MMSVRWELPRDDAPGSLQFLGRELRSRFAIEQYSDRSMAELIGKLDALPSVRTDSVRP